MVSYVGSVSVTVMVATLITLLSDSKLPAVFHSMLTVPNVALANALASRVFRDVWLDAAEPTPEQNNSLTWRAAPALGGVGSTSTTQAWSSTDGSHFSRIKGWGGKTMDEETCTSRNGDTYPLDSIGGGNRIPKQSTKNTFML
jgi:hypothetical protein